MIRLVIYFGSGIRDFDVLVVSDTEDEGYEYVKNIKSEKAVDATVMETGEFLRYLNRDPFLVNVLLNGKVVVKNNIDLPDPEALKRYIERTVHLQIMRLCNYAMHTESEVAAAKIIEELAYLLNIARGRWPATWYEAVKVLGPYENYANEAREFLRFPYPPRDFISIARRICSEMASINPFKDALEFWRRRVTNSLSRFCDSPINCPDEAMDLLINFSEYVEMWLKCRYYLDIHDLNRALSVRSTDLIRYLSDKYGDELRALLPRLDVVRLLRNRAYHGLLNVDLIFQSDAILISTSESVANRLSGLFPVEQHGNYWYIKIPVKRLLEIVKFVLDLQCP